MHHMAKVAPAFGFLSTPSVWRATEEPMYVFLEQGISIHALRVEGDPWCW